MSNIKKSGSTTKKMTPSSSSSTPITTHLSSQQEQNNNVETHLCLLVDSTYEKIQELQELLKQVTNN